MERAGPGVRFGLYAAAASGVLVSGVVLLSAAWPPYDREALARALYASFGLACYGWLAIFAGTVCRPKARRAWMAACAFVSLSVAVLGGGPLGVAFVIAPAGVLTWLASREESN